MVELHLPNMRFFGLFPVLFFPLLAVPPARAVSNSADAPHVHVELINDEFAADAPDEILAGLHFKLEPGWHVYWKNPGDAGEPPKINWTLPNGVKADAIEFPAPKRLPLGPLMDFGYEDEVVFPVRIFVDSSFKPGSAVHLAAKVTWLVCRESCIPGKANLELDVPIIGGKPGGNGAAIPLLERFRAALPKALPAGSKVGFSSTAAGFKLTVETGRKESEASFFPADPDVLDNPAPQKLTPAAKGISLELKRDANLKDAPKQLRGVIELSGGRAFEIAALPGMAAETAGGGSDPGKQAPADRAPDSQSPVEPATVNRVPTVGTSGQPAGIAAPAAAEVSAPGPTTTGTEVLRAAGLAFLGGLLLNLMPCVFPVLFLKGLALVRSGNQERTRLRAHGFVYAAGILVSFWVLVGALLGLRAAGAVLGWGFQFQSPVFLALMAGLLFFLGLSLAGQFEVGLTLTSAGGALAAKEGYAGSFFTGVLAVIVATPCTAPLMGPAIGYALAQTAVVSFAVFTALALGLAVPYVALTLQPAWTRWLPRPGVWMEVLRQATAVPIFATVIWLAWVLAQAYGAGLLAALLASFLLLAIAGWFLGRWPGKRWASAVAAAIVALAVVLSVVAPKRWAGPASAAASEAGQTGWQPWSAEAVSRAQTAGRPVLVDFTASWCLSCQVNEKVALSQPEVQKAFEDRKVVLLRADWTRHDEAITRALTALGRSGVPAYALYVPGEKGPRMLPEALTPGIVLDAIAGLPPVNR